MEKYTCKKIKFDSEAHVLGFIKTWEATQDRETLSTPMSAYFCPKCFSWHTTSGKAYVKRADYDRVIARLAILQVELDKLKVIVEKGEQDRLSLSQLLSKAQMIEVVDLSEELKLLKYKYELLLDENRKSRTLILNQKDYINGIVNTNKAKENKIKELKSQVTERNRALSDKNQILRNTQGFSGEFFYENYFWYLE